MHFITGMYSASLYITTCHARDGVSETPEHSNDIYLPSSSLIGDTDTVAWLRATRCTGTRPHRASQAPIVCTVLHCMQRRPSKPQNRRPCWSSPAVERQSLLWRSAKTSVHFCARTAHAPTFGPKRRHAEGPCRVRMPRCPWILQAPTPCRPQSLPKIKGARASKGVKSLRFRSPLLLLDPSHPLKPYGV